MAADKTHAVQVEGVKETARALRGAPPELKKELKAAHKDAAEMVAGTARPLAPSRTGLLRANIRAGATMKSGVVRAGSKKVPYAGVIHFGWARHNIRPNPFLYEALDRRANDVFKAYEAAVEDVIRKVET